MQSSNDYSLMLWQQVRGLARRGDDAIGWRAQARLDCVRGALRSADTLTVQELQREFGEIEIDTVLSSLLDVLKDAALIVLASTSVGGAAGAAVGALVGGVGAIPGAAAGAALGAKVGGWILAVLGLKALADFFIEGLPAILDHYSRGLSRAWAAPDHDRAGDDLRGGQRRQSEVRGAAVDISKGHVAMVLLLLSALVAYLTRGRGNIGQLAAQARRGRLGTRFADWIVKHEAALRNHPRLQGKRNRVAGESTASDSAQTRTLNSSKADKSKVPLTITEKKALARDFYLKQGYDPKRVDSHLAGIDFNRPVEVVTLPKGTPVMQWQAPGGSQGSYYALPGTQPGNLGISPQGLDRATGQVIGKVPVRYVTTDKVEVLRSTAAAIDDTWSIPGQTIRTEGGGLQMLNANKTLFQPILRGGG